MRVFYLLLSLLAGLSIVHAIPPITTPVLPHMSTCGLSCLATTAPKLGCLITDIKCQCQSQQMTDLTMNCMLANCTEMETFELLKQVADICQRPDDSRQAEVMNMLIIFSAISKTFVITRLIIRVLAQGNFELDDWLIFVSMLTDTLAFYAALRGDSLLTTWRSMIELVMTSVVSNEGFGNHVWNVEFSNLKDILLWFYIILALYIITNGIIKLSILSFYLRIFSAQCFHKWCWYTTAFGIAIMITFLSVSIFQCVPISYAWQINPKGGFCVNFNAATWVYSVLIVAQDILVLVLPVMQVKALQVNRKKKLSVLMVFVLGGFAVVASIIRLSSLHGFGRTSDPTFTNVSTTIWSAIELSVGMVSASIPGIYSGLRVIWPGFNNFTKKHLYEEATGNGSGQRVLDSKRDFLEISRPLGFEKTGKVWTDEDSMYNTPRRFKQGSEV